MNLVDLLPVVLLFTTCVVLVVVLALALTASQSRAHASSSRVQEAALQSAEKKILSLEIDIERLKDQLDAKEAANEELRLRHSRAIDKKQEAQTMLTKADIFISHLIHELKLRGGTEERINELIEDLKKRTDLIT